MAELKGKILAGKVLVEPQQAITKTAGGIIIPDSAKEKPLAGKVVLVGIARKDETMEVKAGDTVFYGKYSGTELTIDGEDAGDTVFYGKYSGTELTIDGEDYLLISQSDVLFIA